MDNFFYLHGYFIELEKNGKKPGTIKQYRSDLQQFISWLDTTINQDLLDVDAVAIMSYVAYLKERSYRDTTIKRHLSLVHRFLAFYHVPVDSSSEQENIYRAPPLQSSDFISNNEMDQLLQSMQRPIQSIARDILIPRNLAIVHLMRYQGLRPKEITSITMRMINLAQSTIEFNWNGERINYTLANTHMTYIRDYIATIAPH
ncbi:site-specific recombinase [Gracilibacillus boraciitolerans JCM 21714]|uniref:Site-specific recombinase n=1 Tax=Gracilibacillus boraciitolerans JCM 21714 TaxID=1298598 RepID=W4VJ05_9BACI|nr:site-specific integrase [Gracilibacillus boraciitolerans]GAE93131.1 site-specific recombinase [Gracilibacillus boraciitolerans JCM 21714]